VGPILVRKYIGPDEGQLANAVSLILAWLLNSPTQGGGSAGSGGPGSPNLKVLAGGASILVVTIALAACGAFRLSPQDEADLAHEQEQLLQCQAVGREAGSYAAYEHCTKEAGL
jgi:hypothetical protein